MTFFVRYDVNLKAMRKRINQKGLYKKKHKDLLNKLLDMMEEGRLSDAFEFYCSDAWDVQGDIRPREFLDCDLTDLFEKICFGYWVRPEGIKPLSDKLPEKGKLWARRAIFEEVIVHLRCRCGRHADLNANVSVPDDVSREIDLNAVPTLGWNGWTYKLA